MEVDPNKIVDKMSNQIAQLSFQNAALQAQLETVVEAYNKLVAGDVSVAEAEPVERVIPDEVIENSTASD